MNASAAYLNGEWIPETELRIPIDDLGFTMGAAVVERWRTFGHQVFRLDMHLTRMRRSLEIIGLDSGKICSQLQTIVPEGVRRATRELDLASDLGIVAIATPGRGNQPTIAVHWFPLPFHVWACQYDAGVRTTISHVRQVPTNCWPSELKCRSRMHYFLADQAARNIEPSARAILLDQEGYVGEATSANVLIYRSDRGLISPPLQRILPGVTLAVTTELCAERKIPFSQRLFTAAELKSAEEVLLVSTSICALPVVKCDDSMIGGGKPGPVFLELLEAWNTLVGVDIAAQARRFINPRS